MIVTEFYETRSDGVNLYRTHSNAGYRIRQEQTDTVYDEAIDVENSGYTYTETEEKIDESDEEETQQLAQAALVMMGVEE